jgi:dihydroxyacetone kinase-like protein
MTATLDANARRALIEAVAAAVIARADELTALDQAIGDGDHGLNMKRGFEAVLADTDAIAAKPLPDGLKQIGTTLVMKVGGASGPLYGTLFLQLGKSLAALAPDAAPSREQLAAALADAIAAVKARGKSETGQKTLLDVLAPVQAALAGGDGAAALVESAHEAAAATVPLKAIRGRASFLGDRSIGHMDPGARSSEILITAVAGFATANGASA